MLQPESPPGVIVPAVLGGGVQVGDDTFSVGNPLGLADSITAGVVSGLDRTIAARGRRRRPRAASSSSTPRSTRAAPGGPLLNRAGPGGRHRHRAGQPDRAALLRRHRLRRADRAARRRRRAARQPRRQADRDDRTRRGSTDGTPHRRPCRPDGAGAVRGQEGHRRPGRAARAAGDRAARPRAHARRGRARPGQDAGDQDAGRGDRRAVPAHPVHARPRARRPRRHPHLQPALRRVQDVARPGVHQPAARRRDQPRAGQGAERRCSR